MVFGPESPDAWALASDEERARGDINRDLCVLPGEDAVHYFIRGELRLPVTDAVGEYFVWSVWASLSERNMELTARHWEDPARVSMSPMFGWLCNWLPPYGSAPESLAVNVHHRAPGVAPLIELDPTADHPLVHEQVNGISLHRVAELNRLLLDS